MDADTPWSDPRQRHLSPSSAPILGDRSKTIVASPYPVWQGDLSAVDLKILDPGAANADGCWTYEGEMVVRIHALWMMMVAVADRGLRMREARLRLRVEGMD